MRKLLTTLALASLVQAAGAQQVRYVTDSIRLETRTGPSTEHRIVSMLQSGTEVEVLETSDGWTRIALPDGGDGWMLSRYLIQDQPARSALEEAQTDLDTVRKENDALIAELQTWRTSSEELERTRDELARSSDALASELSELKRTAAGAMAMRDENQRLNKQLRELEVAHTQAVQAHTVLRGSRERDWFIAGGGVLFIGMVLGLVIPKVRWRRRKSWGEL